MTQYIPRIGFGYDVHAFTTGKFITLCGIKIHHTHSFKAHSDGDVALHALTDAIYGSLALGDIGVHFPPSVNKWKNIESSFFLKHALKCVTEKKGYIGNIDLTIICEVPKIQPFSLKMRQKISTILNIDIDKISIKATTSESLGFTGRKEGIATYASVLVFIPNTNN